LILVEDSQADEASGAICVLGASWKNNKHEFDNSFTLFDAFPKPRFVLASDNMTKVQKKTRSECQKCDTVVDYGVPQLNK
jgi:hypothetical protein